MDFRDRQAIKKLELTIDRFLSEGGPFVLSNGIHFSRMNDDIINNIKRPDLVLMPFGHAKHHFFVIVAKNYAEAWPLKPFRKGCLRSFNSFVRATASCLISMLLFE